MSDSRADDARYAAERVMEPILRRWLAIDLEPVNLWSNAENAAVDLSYALEDAGLLLPIQLVIKGAMSADLKCFCENPKPGAHAQVAARAIDGLRVNLLNAEAERDAALARVLPEGVVEIDGQRFTLELRSPPAHPARLYRLIPYRPEDTKGGE